MNECGRSAGLCWNICAEQAFFQVSCDVLDEQRLGSPVKNLKGSAGRPVHRWRELQTHL